MEPYTSITSEQQVPQAILKQLSKIVLNEADRFNHVAFCMSKGRIVSMGRNSYSKTHPRMEQLAIRVGETKKRAMLHAEVAAMVKIRQKIDSIFVFRISKSGKWLNSTPCPSCSLAIAESGLKCFHS